MSRVASRKKKRRHLSPIQKLLFIFSLLIVFGLCSTVFLDMKSMREAYEALEELVEWGSCSGPFKKDPYNTYRASEVKPSRRAIKKAIQAGKPAPQAFELGEARPVPDAHELYESEYRQQYRSLPFWKRSVVLLAGITVNLLFAMLSFVVIYTIIGLDVQNTQTGEIFHVSVPPLDSIQLGFSYIGMVVEQVANLFNPQTAAETVSNSTSIVGIAVMSRSFFAQGFVNALFFMAAISVSLGIMNLLPIPPLDGGRFVVEVYQKITSRLVTPRAFNYISAAGMVLFLGFFLILLNQDIQRLFTGYWG